MFVYSSVLKKLFALSFLPEARTLGFLEQKSTTTDLMMCTLLCISKEMERLESMQLRELHLNR